MKIFGVFVTCFLIAEGFIATDQGNISIWKREATKCKETEHECGSGECISLDNFCDGREDCTDGSDETTCQENPCPAYLFRCTYGACIAPDMRCNGVKDCKDNSDEYACAKTPDKLSLSSPPLTPLTTPLTVSTGSECLLPEYPKNGKWALFVPSTLKPGESVEPNAVLVFSCNNNYKLMPNVELALCNNKNWTIVPKCIKTCPSLSQSKNLIISCSFNGSPISCDSPYEGTKATVRCADFYEDPSIKITPFRFCYDGSWDYPLPICKPVCGVKPVNAQRLIRTVAKINYPWHVGIYKDYQYICGGSIISEKHILTAAHCFQSTDTETYSVGAGKYYYQYNDTRDNHAQFSKVAKILIHKDFNEGNPFYAFDLAVLVLENPFQMSRYVLPVCLDVTDVSKLINRQGIVIGSGHGDETPIDNLQELEVEYKPKDSCDLPDNFKQYYIPYAKDKLCASVLSRGPIACRGIGGGGLVFLNDSGRYVLRGITSIAPVGKCDSIKNILFTSVQDHISYIEQLKSMHRV